MKRERAEPHLPLVGKYLVSQLLWDQWPTDCPTIQLLPGALMKPPLRYVLQFNPFSVVDSDGPILSMQLA